MDKPFGAQSIATFRTLSALSLLVVTATDHGYPAETAAAHEAEW